MYDYLIVGAGLFGSVFAREVAEAGRRSLIIERRQHVGGNVYTEDREGVMVHVYGPHLFHADKRSLWDYVNRFAEFNHYRHKVRANYDGRIYSLPFNMMTYYQLWGCTTPADARREIEKQRVVIDNPTNLEEWALSQVGRDIYDKLIYGYTKKQWMRSPRELPSFIIRRLPLRFTYNDDYHNDRYNGIPVDGYTRLVENILDHPNIEVRLNEDFFDLRDWAKHAEKLVYTGSLDRFFDFEFGELEYRTLRFEHQVVDGDFQGTGQMNYTEESVPYTRIVEHKHFVYQESPRSVITYEYPEEWKSGAPPYLPINDDRNNTLHGRYRRKIAEQPNVIGGGRLFDYRYYDMHQVIAAAIAKSAKDLSVRTP